MMDDVAKMNRRILIEKHDNYTKDTLNGYTNTWYPFYGVNDAAESGTTTTNIKMTAHGLSNGDYIINSTRSNAVRSVTKVDADNITVSTVTGQTTADVIKKYPRDKSTVWASVTPNEASYTSRGKEYNDDKQEVAITHKIKTRYREDITSDMRFRLYPDLTRIFEIAKFFDSKEEHKYLVILVREVK